MTSNSVRAAENEVSGRRANEEKRHNRKTEGAQNFANYGKGAQGFAKAGESLGALFAANDPAWYTQDKQLTKDVGSLSFGRPAGLPVDFNGIDVYVAHSSAYTYVPTIGSSGLADIVAKNVYAFVRYKNSGHANYDSPDLVMYILAMDSMFSLWALGVRMYNVAKYINTMNRATPVGLATACGFNYIDISKHLNDLRSYVNQLRLRLSPFYLPKDLTYYQRHMWLCSNVFADDKLQKTQYHVFKPGIVFRYNEAATLLNPVAITDEFTFDSYVSKCEQVLGYLTASESIGIMSGDILKAYGSENVVKLAQLAEESTLQVVYSEEVLEQIKNASSFEYSQSTSGYEFEGFYIGQKSPTDPSIVQGFWSISAAAWVTTNPTPWIYSSTDVSKQYYRVRMSGPNLLTAYEDQPAPERVFTATRLSVIAEDVAVTKTIGGTPTKFSCQQCTSVGSEVVVRITVLSLGGNSYVSDGTSIDPDDILDILGLVCQFSYFPTFRLMRNAVQHTSSPSCYYYHITGENIISVSKHELSKLHDVAMMSEFGLPYTADQNKPAFR